MNKYVAIPLAGLKVWDVANGELREIENIRFEGGTPVEVWTHPGRKQLFNQGVFHQFDLVYPQEVPNNE